MQCLKMRLCGAIILFLASLAWAEVRVEEPVVHTAHGYIRNIGIPRGDAIRKAEEKLAERIVGGLPAALGQYPFQAGLIGDITGETGRSVCGGSLISANRVLTAAHCWNDGITQVWRFTVILGSTLLFSGGTRVESSIVAMHPNWSHLLVRNDVAIIYLPNAVPFSNIIALVALPTGSQVNEDFVGEPAIAVGYGITSDGGGISADQSLSHVRLKVIANSVCSYAYPFLLQSSHMCTSGLGGTNICSGDSGGPLLATRNGELVQIGISSFVSLFGCGSNFPGAYSRVTSFLDFINSNL